jgi:hypothetical protein
VHDRTTDATGNDHGAQGHGRKRHGWTSHGVGDECELAASSHLLVLCK